MYSKSNDVIVSIIQFIVIFKSEFEQYMNEEMDEVQYISKESNISLEKYLTFFMLILIELFLKD